MKSLLLALFLLLPGLAGAQVLATIPVSIDGTPENFGPVTLPAAATLARVVFESKDALAGGQTITVAPRISFNGGLTEQPIGGAVFHAANQPSTVVIFMPQQTSEGRVLSGRVTLYGGKWRGKVFIEIE